MLMSMFMANFHGGELMLVNYVPNALMWSSTIQLLLKISRLAVLTNLIVIATLQNYIACRTYWSVVFTAL